jgi:flagellar basal-body rod modification protein FlgD
MAIDIDGINNAGANQQTAPTKKKDEMGQQEFLTLLVAQLQNQDPLNPLESQEFAAQLATFTQLEQLISINNKIDALGSLQSDNPVGNMANLLGREIVVKDGNFSVTNGKGSHLLVEIPEGVQSIKVEILGGDGTVLAYKELSEFKSGKNFIGFDDIELGSQLGVQDGNYIAKVTAVDSDGQFKDLELKYTETVQGFVLEPAAALVVNGRHVGLDEISEVY